MTPVLAIDRPAQRRVAFGLGDRIRVHRVRANQGASQLSIEPQATDELAGLLTGAATLSRAGNRVAAIAALLSAVALAPNDLTAHRRLAAAYAIAGNGDRARSEYDRFIERLEARGLFDAAAVERSYAAVLFAPPPCTIAAPAGRRLTADQASALRRVAVAVVAITATVAAMLAAGAQIFASGGPL